MVLPLTLLRAGKSQPTLIELKNGETYSGILESCDAFMNMHMLNVVCTSKSGNEFWKLNECYIRGNNVKSFRLPNEVAEIAKEEKQPSKQQNVTYSARGRGNIQGPRQHPNVFTTKSGRGDLGNARGRGQMGHGNPRR